MPDYEHICTDNSCKFEWESTYSIKIDPPKNCPKCGKETAKRLISLNGKGVVELVGHELAAKVKEDTIKLKQDLKKSDKLYSNLIGESKYNELQTKLDRRKRK